MLSVNVTTALRSTTYVPKTGTINQLQKSGSNFWLICHANVVSVSSRTRFWCRLEHFTNSSQNMTEMIIYDLSPAASYFLIFSFINQVVNSLVVIYLCCFQPCLFSVPEISIQMHYGTKKRANRNQSQISTASLWCRFLASTLWT